MSTIQGQRLGFIESCKGACFMQLDMLASMAADAETLNKVRRVLISFQKGISIDETFLEEFKTLPPGAQGPFKEVERIVSGSHERYQFPDEESKSAITLAVKQKIREIVVGTLKRPQEQIEMPVQAAAASHKRAAEEDVEAQEAEKFKKPRAKPLRNVSQESALQMVKANGLDLQKLKEEFRKNPLIVKAAVTNNPLALEFACKSLQKDEEIVVMCLKKNLAALEFVDKKLKNSPSFLFVFCIDVNIKKEGLAAIERYLEPSTIENLRALYQVLEDPARMAFLDRKLCDFCVRRAFVKANWKLLDYVSYLKQDKKLILEVVKKLKNQADRDYFLKLFKFQPTGPFAEAALQLATQAVRFQDLPEALRNDEILVEEATAQDIRAIQFIGPMLAGHREYIKSQIEKNCYALSGASDVLKKDEELVMLSVSRHITGFQYAHETLKSNKAFVLQVVKQNGWSIQFVDPIMRRDRDIALTAVKTCFHVILDLQVDPFFSQEHIHRELVLSALETNPLAMIYAYTTDREFMLQALERNHLVFNRLPEVFRGSLDFILEAASRNVKILSQISILEPIFKQAVYGFIELKGSQINSEELLGSIQDEVAARFLRAVLTIVKNPKQIENLPVELNKDLMLSWFDLSNPSFDRSTLDKSKLPKEFLARLEAYEAVCHDPFAIRNYPQFNQSKFLIMTALKMGCAKKIDGIEFLQHCVHPQASEVVKEALLFAFGKKPLKEIAEPLASSRELFSILISQNPDNFQYAKGKLRFDQQFILPLLVHYPGLLAHVPTFLRNDPQFMLEAIRSWACVKYIGDKLLSQDSFLHVALEKNLFCILSHPKYCKNEALILSQIRRNKIAATFADASLKINPEFQKKVKEIDPEAIKYLVLI